MNPIALLCLVYRCRLQASNMSKSIFVIIVYLIIIVNSLQALETVNGKIKITIGTTSGCTATMNFISTQLTEAYDAYKQFLEVEFFPWGRTQRLENGILFCQFGPNDCWANRVHRCALDQLKGNQDAQVNYMICEFSNPYPAFSQGTYTCAQSIGLSLVNLDYCVATSGGPLDEESELAAKDPMEIINLVPTIHFNDIIDVDLRTEARSRLKSMICFALAEDPSTGITNCQI